MNSLFSTSGAELSALGSIFIKLLNISIAAGWIVLAAVVIRRILKRAPKWAVCLLWLVVAVRLVMPFSIESPLSLVPSAETVVVIEKGAGEAQPWQQGAPGTAAQPGDSDLPGIQTPGEGLGLEIHSGFSAVNSYINPKLSGSETNEPVQPEITAPAPSLAKDPVGSWLNGLAIAWAGGIFVMLAYASLSYAKLRRTVKASVLQSSGVYICDEIDTPFILGIVRPRIYLPSGLTDAEKEHVLAHEHAHLRRRDQLWKPLGFALLAVYWFNPLMWLAYALFCRDIELACDEKVIGVMDEGSKADYSRTLVACSSRQRIVTACPLAFGEVGTGERIKSVLSYKKPAFWIIIAAVITCIVLAVCFLTDPKRGDQGRDQGKVYIWFETHTARSEVQIPEFPGVSFSCDGERIYMKKNGSSKVVVQGMPVVSAYFCDINGDGKPELCTSCTMGSGFVDQRVIVYDIAKDSQLELSDRGNFDYSLAERNGRLIVMKRAFERTSSVGEDALLAVKGGQIILLPLGPDKAAAAEAEQLTPLDPPENNNTSGDPDITINGTGYYNTEEFTSYLPFGYTLIDRLTPQQAGTSGFADLAYFMADQREDIYLESGKCVESVLDGKHAYITYKGYVRMSPDPRSKPRMTIEDALALAQKQTIVPADIARFVPKYSEAGYAGSYTFEIDSRYNVFIRFDDSAKADILNIVCGDGKLINLLAEDARPYIESHCVQNIIDTAEVHATALEKFWEQDGLEFWFPSIQSDSMYVVMADGSRTPLIDALSEGLILVTDIPRFGFMVYIRGLYEGELKGLIPDEARLAVLKERCPKLFGLDASNGLTIYVSSFAPNHCTCGLLAGNVSQCSLSELMASPSVNGRDMKLILASEYANVPDSKIIVRPYNNPISSYLVIDKEAYANQLKALFGGRFKVGENISFAF